MAATTALIFRARGRLGDGKQSVEMLLLLCYACWYIHINVGKQGNGFFFCFLGDGEI